MAQAIIHMPPSSSIFNHTHMSVLVSHQTAAFFFFPFFFFSFWVSGPLQSPVETSFGAPSRKRHRPRFVRHGLASRAVGENASNSGELI